MADQKVLETFKRFDSDGSGSISREELGEAGAEGPSILSTPFP
jgi:Ca2+-binding EF-hand superfamily protein